MSDVSEGRVTHVLTGENLVQRQLEALGKALGSIEKRVDDHDSRVEDVVMTAVREALGGIAPAVLTGMKGLLEDEAAIDQLVDRMLDRAHEKIQANATTYAGRGVWWFLKNVVSRWVFVGVVVVFTAKALGWDLATKLGKFLAAP